MTPRQVANFLYEFDREKRTEFIRCINVCECRKLTGSCLYHTLQCLDCVFASEGVTEFVKDSTVKAVDLGLPSGTLWADRNVGAKAPEDYGAYFMWGNTEPHYPLNKGIEWGDIYHAFDEKNAFSRENYEKFEGFEFIANIDPSHDAARINMGEPWQMPTLDQISELRDFCTWERKNRNGINGYLVKSMKNGNFIFIACSGYVCGTTLYNLGVCGGFWLSLKYNAQCARSLNFYNMSYEPYYETAFVWSGFPVRGVCSRQKT